MRYYETLYLPHSLVIIFVLPEKSHILSEKAHIYNKNACYANIIVISGIAMFTYILDIVFTTNATLNVSHEIGSTI